MLIEFLGIAGSGKTTIAREVVRRLETRGIRVGYGPDVGRIEGLSAVLLRPHAFLMMVRAVRKFVATPSERRMLLKKMVKVYGRILSLRKRHQVIVLDEGILHKFRKVRAAAKGNLSIAEAAGSLSVSSFYPLPPSIIILINTGAEEISQRISSRDGRNLHCSPDAVDASYERSLRDVREVLDVFPNARLVLPENNSLEDVQRISQQIVEQVDQVLMNP